MQAVQQPLIRLEFFTGFMHGLLISQSKRWTTSLSPAFQFLIMGIFASQVVLINDLFSRLPENTYELLLSNLFEPTAFFCTLVLVLFGFLSLAYSIGVAKIMKSLVDRKL